MSAERAVTFPNADGQALFGILHDPPVPRGDIGVLLLSPGVKSRVGPHRLYRKMAPVFTELGCPVLRFDFAGLGDSGGDIPERLLPDLYRSIQLGRYTADTVAAIDWMRAHTGVRRVLLAGLCGGAITGMVAARESAHVAGLLGIGIPVGLDGTAVDKVAAMSEGQLRRIRRGYLAKLADPKSWMRVLSFKTDFRLLARALWSSGPRPAQAARADVPAVTGENGNPEFSPALLGMLARREPVLFVFSGSDRLYWEYRERFADPHAERLAPLATLLDVKVIEHANHVLTFSEWQRELFDLCRAWMTRHFPAPSAPASSTAGAGGRQDSRPA